ncbi:MAG TPA: hypothetical protein VLY04_12645 [Bryobacteraceae bacterium]|nr:hypothetical protein [Bryobacteraceae bacterium]
MNCQEFWNTAPQPGAEAEVHLASHLAECPACATKWEHQRALAAGLRLVAEEWRSVEAPARVEAGLTAAFRAQKGFERRPARSSWWMPVLAWASAAAAMVVVSLFLVRGWQPTAEPRVPLAAPQRTGPVTLEFAAQEQDGGAPADMEDDSSGLGNDFIRLPNAARIEPNEDVNLVRVEVPRSTLIALGLTVSEDRTSDSVLADVVLGSDGMARAVRVVDEGGSLE